MGSSVGDRDRLFTDSKGLQLLLKDLKALQHEGSKTGDLKFTLKDGKFIKAHSLIIKTRCKNFKGNLTYNHVSEEIFNLFLTYIYTGKLKADNSLCLYNVYLLSLEFGMEDLSTGCEDIILSNLDHNSALQILKEGVESLKSQETNGNKESEATVRSAIQKLSMSPIMSEEIKPKVQRMIDTCITFLSEHNPSALKKNMIFLSLPIETIKSVLQSEHLCLEEEEVWRCVLNWSQHKAGIDSHVTNWTEEERVKVSQYLTPVISHVKLLLIDSRVFAEEVEPTGCVPMALSLERYRFAALSSFEPAEGSDPRLRPRNAQKLFHSSLIINNERIGLGKKLQEWYITVNPTANANTNWKCIYRASKHGFGAEDFHSRVDGIPFTYVVVLLRNTKWVCGGFTDVPWNSTKTPKFLTSSKSFLFALNPSTGMQPVQFPVTKRNFAVGHDANSGPIFGAGADLYISSFCGSNAESYSNLPHSYELNSTNSSHQSIPSPPKGQKNEENNYIMLTPSYNFTVADYEVFVPN